MNARPSVAPFPSARRFDNDVARKAEICANVLAEARRLADQRKFGPPLNQLIARACELLDDLDEILIALDPARDAVSFAAAAMLHRGLEHVQTAISAPSRRRVSYPATGLAR